MQLSHVSRGLFELAQSLALRKKMEHIPDIQNALDELIEIFQTRFWYLFDIPCPFDSSYDKSEMSNFQNTNVQIWRETMLEIRGERCRNQRLDFNFYPKFSNYLVISCLLDPTFFGECFFPPTTLQNAKEELRFMYERIEIEQGDVQWRMLPSGIFTPSESSWDGAWTCYVSSLTTFRQQHDLLFQKNLINNTHELTEMFFNFWNAPNLPPILKKIMHHLSCIYASTASNERLHGKFKQICTPQRTLSTIQTWNE